MTYTEVSDPLLQHDYYRGIMAIDPSSTPQPTTAPASPREQLRQTIAELKTLDAELTRRIPLLEKIQYLLDQIDKEI